MINRIAKNKLIDLSTKFKAVAVTGARQTGKTTLVRETFKTKPYLSLENTDTRNFALEDPQGKRMKKFHPCFIIIPVKKFQQTTVE